MNPRPGKFYVVEEGDSLTRIAKRAYGDGSFWDRIWAANQTRLRSGDPDIVFPGEEILIPVIPERQLPPVFEVGGDVNRLRLVIGDREILPQSAAVTRALDTVADGYRFTIPWVFGQDPEIDEAIAPYSYNPAAVFIGPDRVITGFNYSVETRVENGRIARLSGGGPALDLVDSVLRPPFEFANITLADLLAKIVSPLGIRVIFEADGGGPFDRVTASTGDTILKFLARLARQRGVLITSNPAGDIVVTQAAAGSESVAVLEEEVTPGVTGWGIRLDGRRRFNSYRAVGRSPSGNSEALVTDDRVPRSRFTTVSADETTSGDIEAAAQWGRNRALAEALTFELVVPEWRDLRGGLWQENTIITVVSPTMFVPDGFDFLVNRVTYLLSERGRQTRLNFVPPSVYTQGDIREPW